MTPRTPRKRFGQNFLHDAGVIRRIIECINPQPTDRCVEIGPGRGALTQHLHAAVASLDVIEIDRDLAADLAQQSWAGNIRIHCADALEFDFATLRPAPASLRLVGNLPYNISTPLLFHMLDHWALFQDAHVMLQKEVVDRMCATPGNRSYGRLSVTLAARCRVESLITIKPGAFTPAPQVQSAFARLSPWPQARLHASEAAHFDEIVRCAFGQRRKQLGNALQGRLDAGTLRTAGIDPARRAETLSVDEFLLLSRVAQAQSLSEPPNQLE